MSGTSSSTSSSTSGRGRTSSRRPERESMQDGVAGADLAALERVGQLGHPLLVGAAHDHGAVAVVEQLLERDHLAGHVRRAGQDHVERLVEDHLGAAGQVDVAQVGVHRHAHLATAGEHVHGAVVVAAEQGAVGRRGLGQLLDLVAQGGDVLAGLAQGVGQLLVLRHRLGQLALRLEQPLLEGADALGRVLQAAPEGDDLLLQRDGLLAQLGHLRFEGGDPLFKLGFVDENHLLERSRRTLHRPSRDTTEPLDLPLVHGS